MDIQNVPIMPEEYLGRVKKTTGYTVSEPREYTQAELDWILKLKEEGWNNAAIAKSVGRTETAISIKMKRLHKKTNDEKSYNHRHRNEKYAANDEFIQLIKPKSVIDAFSGTQSYYKTNTNIKNVITNDSNRNIEADHHMPALKFLCYLHGSGISADVVDLDSFGSSFECTYMALCTGIAKRGLVVTLGELGHRRWKRLEYVRDRYGINSMEEFTTENIIKSIQKLGLMCNKILTPVIIKDWKAENIARVYFTIEKKKITEQWEHKKIISE